MTPKEPNSSHTFGGAWTDQKLSILRNYLVAYSTALSKQERFKIAYIDAFAGTGSRESSADARWQESHSGQLPADAGQGNLMDDLDTGAQSATFLDGSARIALQVEPHFHSYVFIEKQPSRCLELEKLKTDFPDLAKRISIRPGDANEVIQAMCNKDWTNNRAVLFLDPYGTQVKWRTIEAIAQTQAIDLWVLFPIGGVNRMLTQSGSIPPGWRTCLDDMFGTTDWYDSFYRTEPVESLFEDHAERIVKASTRAISDYFISRLKACFSGVAPAPAVLRNSRNSPLYLFCFAAGNPKGAPIALRIASHILKMKA